MNRSSSHTAANRDQPRTCYKEILNSVNYFLVHLSTHINVICGLSHNNNVCYSCPMWILIPIMNGFIFVSGFVMYDSEFSTFGTLRLL